MPPPTLTFGTPLNSEQRALIKRTTGEEFDVAYACGELRASDELCLVNNKQIVTLNLITCSYSNDLDSSPLDTTDGVSNRREDVFQPSPEELSIIIDDMNHCQTVSAPLKPFSESIAAPMRGNCTFGVIERDEPAPLQEWRRGRVQDLYQQLTPEMGRTLRLIDLRPPTSAGGWAHHTSVVRLGGDNLFFDSTFFHEIAHLRTAARSRFRNNYQTWPFPTHTYLGSDWTKQSTTGRDVFSPTSALLRQGALSTYSFMNANEDISETTAFCYTQPGLVRWALGKSPLMRQKVDFLRDEHYISADQHASITATDSVARFEEQWRGITHGEQEIEEDVLATVASIADDPWKVRQRLQHDPVLATKVRLLHEHQFISEAHYHYMTQANENVASDVPWNDPNYCPYNSNGFLDSAACYLVQADRKLTTALIDSIAKPSILSLILS